jgi:uncharacterized protein (TIGR02265 family)
MSGSAREIASTVRAGGAIKPASGIRASVIATSRLAIRALGRDDDYFALLDPRHHVTIREISGVGWLPIDVADAHYRAADGLGLGRAEQRDLGRQVAHRLRDSYAGSIIRSLRAVGALSPHSVLSRFPIAWERLVQGGGARVIELGPKDIRVECLATSIAQYRYVREGWAGMFEGTLELVARTVHVVELAEHRSPSGCGYRVSWV